MRAICLLEADYNWLNKFVFAKQMMDRAFKEEIIPAEQFAKQGSQATEEVPTSGLFCDIARALHRTAAIESVDLANCYDAVAHPIARIALQSFKVRTESYGLHDVIRPRKDDVVPKDHIQAEQNLFWRDEMGSFNGPRTGQWSSASWFSSGLHTNDQCVSEPGSRGNVCRSMDKGRFHLGSSAERRRLRPFPYDTRDAYG